MVTTPEAVLAALAVTIASPAFGVPPEYDRVIGLVPMVVVESCVAAVSELRSDSVIGASLTSTRLLDPRAMIFPAASSGVTITVVVAGVPIVNEVAPTETFIRVTTASSVTLMVFA